MDYTETVDFLFSKLPYFTRDGKAAIKKDLTNTLLFCEHLNQPQLEFKTIHVAGTNGKGSISNMLSSILQEQGYKVGLYTSPHLFDFRERIKINGKEIEKENVVEFVQNNLKEIENIKPSFFEITVAMAFDYFRNQQVDYAVIETGLGGRLDSTNVIHPILSIISNIAYDHMDLLGDTLEKIAIEKAGIIKNNVPVVIGESHVEYNHVFIDKAKECHSKILFADQNNVINPTDFQCDLIGNYQLKNLKTTLQSIDVLKSIGVLIDDENVSNGLKHVKLNTGFYGRWEILQNKPFIVADTAHNEHGVSEVIKQLSTTQYHKLHVVLGMLKDKDRSKILKLFPQNANYYFCSPQLPRAISSSELRDEAKQFGLIGESYDSVKIAISKAKENANDEDTIYIGGSTFVVAEIK